MIPLSSWSQEGVTGSDEEQSQVGALGANPRP